MFLKLEQNTPEIYSEKSRDFQLLCRILNVFLNALIEQSSKIAYNTDNDTLDERLLYLEARKLGFTTHKYFPPNILRNICENFPQLIRRKGTKQAMLDAVYTILSANNLVTVLEIGESNEGDHYTYNIVSNVSDDEINYIAELLSFIVPAGVVWNYIASVNEESSYALPIDLKDNVVRFRGIGSTIARIMSEKFDGLEVKSKGVDWNYFLDDSHDYYKQWGLETTKVPGDSPDRQPFYSKINVVKIIRNSNDTNTAGIAINSISGFNTQSDTKDDIRKAPSNSNS